MRLLRNGARDLGFISLVLIFGAAIRLHLLFASGFVIDADEGIVGLMAKHILEGKGIPTFYYGQHYMGSLEAILTAGMFKLFGISNFALKLVPLLFSLFLIILVYELSFEVSNKRAARFSALLLALPPSALVDWSSKARGGFIEVIVLGTLALLLTVRWMKSDLREPPLFRIAVILGVGWWVNNQIVYFMAPIGLAVLGTILYESRRKMNAIFWSGVVGLSGFLLGGLPFWLYNLEHDFISFQMFQKADPTKLTEHIDGLFSKALPILLGAVRFWHDEEVFPGAITIACIVYGIVFVGFLLYRFLDVLSIVILKFNRKAPLELLLILILAGLFIFAYSSFGYLVQAPRYLLPLYVGIFIIAGYSLSRIRESSPLLSNTLCISILALSLSSSYWGGHAIPGEPFVFGGERVSRDQSELLKWLRENKISWVRTNYWIGYRLAFDTKEEVKFKMFRDPYQIRIAEYEQGASSVAESKIPYILVPSQALIVREALDALHYTYKEEKLSGYTVIYDLHRGGALSEKKSIVEIPRSDFDVAASVKSDTAGSAVDNNMETRWGSGEPQKPGMTYTVEFKKPETLHSITWDAGQWASDYPRGLKIELVRGNGELVSVLNPEKFRPILYLLGEGEPITLYIGESSVKKLVFTELGSDPVFDWSIAELSMFRESAE